MCEIASHLVNMQAHQQPSKGIETILKISELGCVGVCVFSMGPIEGFMLDANIL